MNTPKHSLSTHFIYSLAVSLFFFGGGHFLAVFERLEFRFKLALQQADEWYFGCFFYVGILQVEENAQI